MANAEKASLKNFHRLAVDKNKKLLLLGVALLVVLLVAITVTLAARGDSTRVESYKDVSGAAGLQAVIAHGEDCPGQICDQKSAFDFNVYIYKGDGQQVNVVRPDQGGKVNLALPEGSYVMLIGKQFGKNKLFPQESLVLKNGKVLELKLHYK